MFLMMLACQSDPQVVEAGGKKKQRVDARIDYGQSDAQIILDSPDLIIPAYTEKMHCYFLTYEGPSVGIIEGRGAQNPLYGHHVLPAITYVSEDAYPDGALVDCTEEWVDAEPMIEVTELSGDGTFSFAFPEGLARKLESGQRLMINSHHINTSEEPILVNDRIELYTIPIEEVVEFVAPFWHSPPDIYIPPGEVEITHTCTLTEDLSFLWLMGHMHENGQHFSVDYHKSDGSSERIYEVDAWDPVYRDVPPVNIYEVGELNMSEGESITTTCTYLNLTAETLSFPEEMCTTIGVIYGLEDAVECYE
jgi:hypothetical protein